MKTVLIPTEFSKSARIAIEYALNLFNGQETHYILLNTFHSEHAAGMLIPVADQIHEDVLLSPEKEVNRIENELAHAANSTDTQLISSQWINQLTT